jgi:ribonucleotide reductase beta subunit family protein with ferritin-like domain
MNEAVENREEPVSCDDPERFCLFPIVNTDIFELYKLQEQKFWTAEEVDLSEDAKSFATLNANEQMFISVTLAFFANSDNVVLENLNQRFMKEIKLPEAQLFLSLQGCIEGIHVVTYNMCIDTVIQDPVQKRNLFKAISQNPIVQPKMEWAIRWIHSGKSLAHRIVAFAAVEGIFFSSSFASIFWLRKRQKVPGICFSNEKIVEDESIHVRFAALIYNKYIKYKLTTEEVHGIIREAVDIEHRFVSDALPVKLVGMNSTFMKQYVCKVADVVLTLLGVEPLYNATNPFDWMVGLGLMGKSNFFEKRVSEYVKPTKETSIRSSNVEFTELGTNLEF